MPDLTTVGAALAWAQAASGDGETASLAAQVLLARLLNVPRASVLAHPETSLTASLAGEFTREIERLAAGEPLAYLTGEQEFYGLSFAVSPGVLIPRPETELLVDAARAWLEGHGSLARLRVADVGTGSGCIAVALAANLRGLTILATEIDPRALRMAQVNARRHEVAGRIRFVRTDLIAACARGLDLVCANLPYIPTRALADLAVARHEPWRAFDGGPDGLGPTRRLLAQAQERMNPGACLLLEIEETHGPAACALAREAFPRGKAHTPQGPCRPRTIAAHRPPLSCSGCLFDDMHAGRPHWAARTRKGDARDDATRAKACPRGCGHTRRSACEIERVRHSNVSRARPAMRMPRADARTQRVLCPLQNGLRVGRPGGTRGGAVR